MAMADTINLDMIQRVRCRWGPRGDDGAKFVPWTVGGAVVLKTRREGVVRTTAPLIWRWRPPQLFICKGEICMIASRGDRPFPNQGGPTTSWVATCNCPSHRSGKMHVILFLEFYVFALMIGHVLFCSKRHACVFCGRKHVCCMEMACREQHMGGNNGFEQKRVFGETRPATARYRHIARKEHRGGKRRAFFVLRHANTLFGKYRDKYRDPKKAKRPRRDHKKTRGAGGVAARRAGPAGGWVTPKKQRARIDMPGWQVLVFPIW